MVKHLSDMCFILNALEVATEMIFSHICSFFPGAALKIFKETPVAHRTHTNFPGSPTLFIEHIRFFRRLYNIQQKGISPEAPPPPPCRTDTSKKDSCFRCSSKLFHKSSNSILSSEKK